MYFPYKKIGPMVKATPYGALNVRNTGAALVVSFCALQKIDEKLVFAPGASRCSRTGLFSSRWRFTEKRSGVGPERANCGWMSATSSPTRTIPKPASSSARSHFHNYETTSLEGLYQSAERDDESAITIRRCRNISQCVERDPSHVRALTRLAELYCRRAEYKKALEYARKALDYRHVRSRTPITSTASSPGGWATWRTPRRRWDGRRGP